MNFQIIDWNDICIFHDYDDHEQDNDSSIKDDDNDEEKFYYSIQIFGKNEDGKSICINVYEVYPYFYIKNGFYEKNKFKYIFNNYIEISSFYIQQIESVKKKKLFKF